MKRKEITPPPIESLACVNVECKLYGQAGADNLIVRKIYGKHCVFPVLPGNGMMFSPYELNKCDMGV